MHQASAQGGGQADATADPRPPLDLPLLPALIGVAAAYYLTGWLGLALAIPPGYATAIWPPSGIALAAVLLFGSRVAPAIAFGSFCLNVQNGFDAGTTGALVLSLGIPAAIGIGAALQALAGGALVRRFLGFPNALGEARQVIRLLGLGGLGACLINASIGMAVLYVTGRIPAANIPFSWATWWAGDTVGVFVFAPLIIAWLAPPRTLWRKRWVPITACLGATFSLTVLFVSYTATLEHASFRGRFNEEAARLTEAMRETIAARLDALGSIQALQMVTADRTRPKFMRFAAQLQSRVPGLPVLEWVPRVTAAERAGFEAAGRREIAGDFQIVDKMQQRVGDRAEYFPVTYASPAEGQERALGFDMASLPDRRASLDAARDSGKVTLIEGVTLLQGSRPGDGVLALAPVYADDAAAQTVEGRRDGLIGFALGVFRLSDVADVALRGLSAEDAALWLIDETVPGRPVPLWANTTEQPAALAVEEHGLFGMTASLGSRFGFDVGDRHWVLQTMPTQNFIAHNRLQNSWTVLIVGLLFTSVLGAFAMVVTGRSGVLGALVEQRTADLRDSERRYRLLIDGVADHAICMLDPDGLVASWNAGAERVMGYRADEIVGRTSAIFRTEEDRDAGAADTALATSLATGRCEQEGWRLRKDGSRFWADVVIDPVRDDAGSLIGFATITRDIGPRKAAEDALAQAKLAAERANRTKSEFLAAMSHEIRTPMNGIIGMNGLLLRTRLGDEQRRFAEAIRISADALMGIINDILDVAKLESGKVELESVAFDPAKLVENAVELMTPAAVEKGLAITLDVAPALPRPLLGDPGRLRQILLNLLSNAVKFTPSGHVAVNLHAAPAGEQAEHLVLSVSDSGIGITADQKERLFRNFEQADRSITRRFGGTGLGLSISKQLLDLMGGTIAVADRPGGGCIFTVELLLRRGTAAPAADPIDPVEAHAAPVLPLEGRILLAEDNAINRELATTILATRGYTVDNAGDGSEAIAASQAGCYDLVLMDVQMPNVDGLAAARAIRALGGPAEAVPIVAMTANARPEDRKACLEAGMNDYVSKPIDHDEFLATVARWIAFGRDPPMPGPLDEAPSLPIDARPVVDTAHIDRLQRAVPAERLDTLLTGFADGVGAVLDRMERLGTAPDPADLRRGAEDLLRLSRNFGAFRLQALAGHLGESGAEGEDRDLGDDISALRQAANATVSAFRRRLTG